MSVNDKQGTKVNVAAARSKLTVFLGTADSRHAGHDRVAVRVASGDGGLSEDSGSGAAHLGFD